MEEEGTVSPPSAYLCPEAILCSLGFTYKIEGTGSVYAEIYEDNVLLQKHLLTASGDWLTFYTFAMMNGDAKLLFRGPSGATLYIDKLKFQARPDMYGSELIQPWSGGDSGVWETIGDAVTNVEEVDSCNSLLQIEGGIDDGVQQVISGLDWRRPYIARVNYLPPGDGWAIIVKDAVEPARTIEVDLDGGKERIVVIQPKPTGSDYTAGVIVFGVVKTSTGSGSIVLDDASLRLLTAPLQSSGAPIR